MVVPSLWLPSAREAVANYAIPVLVVNQEQQQELQDALAAATAALSHGGEVRGWGKAGDGGEDGWEGEGQEGGGGWEGRQGWGLEKENQEQQQELQDALAAATAALSHGGEVRGWGKAGDGGKDGWEGEGQEGGGGWEGRQGWGLEKENQEQQQELQDALAAATAALSHGGEVRGWGKAGDGGEDGWEGEGQEGGGGWEGRQGWGLEKENQEQQQELQDALAAATAALSHGGEVRGWGKAGDGGKDGWEGEGQEGGGGWEGRQGWGLEKENQEQQQELQDALAAQQ